MPLLHAHSEHQAITRNGAAPTAGADDRALVAAAQGDPQQFAPLFRRYWEPVLRYCLFRLRDDEAEDAASEIFVAAYAGLPRFRDRAAGGSFRAWLFTIAHHEIANRHRHRARHPAHPWSEAAERIPDPRDSPERAALAAAESAWLLAQVRALPERSREVVELRLAGLTDREIAGVLGISGDAVRQAQARAIAQLRARVGATPSERRNADD
jgi:RNA polymerase sigma-70 factor (ECF subfamily)